MCVCVRACVWLFVCVPVCVYPITSAYICCAHSGTSTLALCACLRRCESLYHQHHKKTWPPSANLMVRKSITTSCSSEKFCVSVHDKKDSEKQILKIYINFKGSNLRYFLLLREVNSMGRIS